VARYKNTEANSKLTARLIRNSKKPDKWVNVCYPNEDAIELEKEWAKKKTRMFAKFCWENRGKTNANGDRWETIFEKREGLNLFQFVADLMRKKL